MVHIKYISLFLSVLIATGCFCNRDKGSNYEDTNISDKENSLNYGKEVLGSEYKVDGLMDHFPSSESIDVISIHVNPPACPPSYECYSQYGDIYLIFRTKNTDSFIPENFHFKTVYSDTGNLIIDLFELKDTIFLVEKCNVYYEEKLPIPYFERYNFGLGKKEEKKIVDGKEYYNYLYQIPSDLVVYVLQAETGDFWEESCNEERPKKLKKWQNGYSKGIAISQKENIVVYWSMLW